MHYIQTNSLAKFTDNHHKWTQHPQKAPKRDLDHQKMITAAVEILKNDVFRHFLDKNSSKCIKIPFCFPLTDLRWSQMNSASSKTPKGRPRSSFYVNYKLRYKHFLLKNSCEWRPGGLLSSTLKGGGVKRSRIWPKFFR